MSQLPLLKGQLSSFGGTQCLTHLIGKTKALELMVVGEQLMAVEAKALGVIGRVVRHRESRSQESREFLHKITAYTTLAVGVLVHCTNAAYSADEDGY